MSTISEFVFYPWPCCLHLTYGLRVRPGEGKYAMDSHYGPSLSLQSKMVLVLFLGGRWFLQEHCASSAHPTKSGQPSDGRSC